MRSNKMEGGGRRAFVGFFGLNRSSRWTAPSVRRNILQPLTSGGFEPFLAGHFNNPSEINHDPSGERGIAVRRNASKDFGLNLQWVEAQSDDNIAELLDAALAATLSRLRRSHRRRSAQHPAPDA